jgi:PPOX class probable F420-dependent enzyme
LKSFNHTMTVTSTENVLAASRYLLLRSYRKDGAPVDTPIWFAMTGDSLVFRTKRGPKTARLRAHPGVELRPCDHRGAVTGTAVVTGRASILAGADAESANRLLHGRYGWQWTIVPLLRVPGVTNVHAELSLREKLRRARASSLWSDSAIVCIDLDQWDPC